MSDHGNNRHAKRNRAAPRTGSELDGEPRGAGERPQLGHLSGSHVGETELSPREKALVGVGVAAASKCPYCVHFHEEEARLADVTETELEEAVTLAGSTQYFSTILHGSEVDLDGFVSETSAIVEHLEEQAAASTGAD